MKYNQNIPEQKLAPGCFGLVKNIMVKIIKFTLVTITINKIFKIVTQL